MIPEIVDEAIQLVKKLWRDVAPTFPHWHGWGIRNTPTGPEMVLYIEPGADDRALLLASSTISSLLPVKVVMLGRFQQSNTNNGAAHAGVLRPGGGVHSVSSSPDCKICPGTVCAFLRTRGNDKTVWLLSNHHVLVKSESCLPVQVFSESNTLLSKEVIPIPLAIHGNRVDAAVAKLIETAAFEPVYDPIEVTSTAPAPLAEGDIVQKLGADTRATCGRVVQINATMNILDCDQENNREFVGQIIIESIPGMPSFLNKGDSGSLVIKDKKPAALLFAITNPESPGPVVGLATPWTTVLEEVSKVIPPPLEMLLVQGKKFLNPCQDLAAHIQPPA